MRYSSIMFDLDGTLLPMDVKPFAKAYFTALAGVMVPLGVSPDALMPAMMSGIGAMVHNDGRSTNADVFWQAFSAGTGVSREKLEPLCDAFYSQEFHLARSATRENPLAREAVRLAREKADKVILATNPLFPMPGQATRLSWLGLSPEDFDLVTCYTSDSFCKPNPVYYTDICRRMGLEPANCLMIGNDDREDMHAASAAGMDVYLVTDCRLPDAENPWTGRQGTFAEMLELLRSL